MACHLCQRPESAISEAIHINYKSVLHITFLHSLISGVDVLNVEHLYIAANVMCGAEIQYFLSFCQASNQ